MATAKKQTKQIETVTVTEVDDGVSLHLSNREAEVLRGLLFRHICGDPKGPAHDLLVVESALSKANISARPLTCTTDRSGIISVN